MCVTQRAKLCFGHENILRRFLKSARFEPAEDIAVHIPSPAPALPRLCEIDLARLALHNIVKKLKPHEHSRMEHPFTK